MRIAEIYKILDEIAPFESAEPWDNSGLIVGSLNSEFERVYLSLDIDSDLADFISPNSLIITHHPLIFNGLKSINYDKYPSNIIAKLIAKNVSLISMHTNYDKHVLNEYFVREILGFEISKKDEFLIYFDAKMSFDELVNLVKNRLKLEQIRAVFAKDEIKRIAVCTGSGMDLAGLVGADAFLTGDIKYHDALTCKENGLNLIDLGHYESELYFGASLAKYLQNFKIEVIITNSKNPFTYR